METMDTLAVLVLVARYEIDGYEGNNLLDKFLDYFEDKNFLAAHAEALIQLDKEGYIKFVHTIPEDLDPSDDVEYSDMESLRVLDKGYEYVDNMLVENKVYPDKKSIPKIFRNVDIERTLSILSNVATVAGLGISLFMN